MMRIARVFPRSTGYTPDDDLVFIGPPPLWPVECDEVHVSCCFTWDKGECERLAAEWRAQGHTVKLGGPAYQSDNSDFVPGRYVREGVTFTSRGCPNRCPWCLVWRWEVGFKLLPIAAGNIIQDNNFLACPREHRAAVYDMLRGRRGVQFVGGLDVRLMTAWDAEQIHGLRLGKCALWFACDTPEAVEPTRRALGLFADLSIEKKRCYVLGGFFAGDTPEAAEGRCQAVWLAGAMPLAMLYRPPTERKRRRWPPEWRAWVRRWSRPAISKVHMKTARSQWGGER